VIHRLGAVESTQVAAAGLPVGSVVVADFQTAGRGRLGRAWDSPPGTGLSVTFVLAPSPVIGFAAGVAAAEACGPGVRLKWPNDLMVGDAKLGGILGERHGEVALIGIGINLTWAPPGAALLGEAREVLLARLIPLLQRWAMEPPNLVLDRWRDLSQTLGRRVRVDLGHEVFEGLAEAIDDDGALIVSGRRIVAGDVTRLRPA